MVDDVGTFDRFARTYDAVMPGARTAPLASGLDEAERDIYRVLDVAGGSGRAVRALEVPERIVLDAAPGMLRQARARGLACVGGDARRLPLRAEAVDAILVVDALHHVPDPGSVIDEARRVLRPGGVLVVREFDPTTVPGRLLVVAEHLFGFDSAFYPPDRLAALVRDAGLDAKVTDRGFSYTVVGLAGKDE